jgi:hypothetical protein
VLTIPAFAQHLHKAHQAFETPALQNLGFYYDPVRDGNAAHFLEHGGSA